MGMSVLLRTQSFCSKHVDLVSCLEFSEDYPKKNANRSSLGLSSSGMRGRQACEDGQMENRGAPVASLAAS